MCPRSCVTLQRGNGVPFVPSGSSPSLVSFPFKISCIQTRLIQISSEFVKFCLKNTQRYCKPPYVLMCIGEAGTITLFSGIQHTSNVAMFPFQINKYEILKKWQTGGGSWKWVWELVLFPVDLPVIQGLLCVRLESLNQWETENECDIVLHHLLEEPWLFHLPFTGCSHEGQFGSFLLAKI